jgi:predicted kinase
MKGKEILEYFKVNPDTLECDWDELCKTFPVFEKMKTLRSKPTWHAEESVFKHTQLAYEYLVNCDFMVSIYKQIPDQVLCVISRLIPAVLLHDIGKSICELDEEGYLLSSGHEELSVKLANEILYPVNLEDRKIILCLIKFHDLRYQFKTMKPTTIVKKVQYIDSQFGYSSELMYKIYFEALFKADYHGAIRTTKKDSEEDFLKDLKELGKYFGSPFQPEIIVMCGLPGSGKSTWVKNFIKYNKSLKSSKNIIVLSRDDIREELFGSRDDIEHEKEVTELFEKRLRAALLERASIIIDNTNIKFKTRERYRKLADEYGYAYFIKYIERPLDELYKARQGEKWKGVIHHMLMEFEYPADKYFCV